MKSEFSPSQRLTCARLLFVVTPLVKAKGVHNGRGQRLPRQVVFAYDIVNPALLNKVFRPDLLLDVLLSWTLGYWYDNRGSLRVASAL